MAASALCGQVVTRRKLPFAIYMWVDDMKYIFHLNYIFLCLFLIANSNNIVDKRAIFLYIFILFIVFLLIYFSYKNVS